MPNQNMLIFETFARPENIAHSDDDRTPPQRQPEILGLQLVGLRSHEKARSAEAAGSHCLCH